MDGYLPVGPFREGGRITEVRLTVSSSVAGKMAWMVFVCRTGSATQENCKAGTPVIGRVGEWSNDLPVVRMELAARAPFTMLLPCSLRVVGGAQWVLVYTLSKANWEVGVICCVVVEGEKRRMADAQGWGVEDGLDR